MKSLKRNFGIGVLVLFGMISIPTYAAQVDIYLVYLGADKKAQKSLKKSLSASYKVKSYNASLLAMADYSGKQKAVSKLSTAKLVVMVTDKPIDLFDGHDFQNSLIIDGEGQENIDKITAALSL